MFYLSKLNGNSWNYYNIWSSINFVGLVAIDSHKVIGVAVKESRSVFVYNEDNLRKNFKFFVNFVHSFLIQNILDCISHIIPYSEQLSWKFFI